jgi:menaquinone-9 beta-reductase
MVWDAIIVGARCAGSPLARFLAREGKRVLLIDAATFPSDQPLSTHFIHGFGMAILDELGLGDRVRAIATPITRMVQQVEDLTVAVRPTIAGTSPRRTDLDQILLDGAREAGAEVRLGLRVLEVVRDGGRVSGVVVEDRDGKREELRCMVVVGADGRNSTIAERVGAAKYLDYPSPRGFYWAYWQRPAWYGDPPYESSTFVSFHERLLRFAFPVNRDQLILGVGFPLAELPRWKQDPTARLVEALAARPHYARIVESGLPITKTIGLVKMEFFFREAAGPGWALVGDAGLHKDPTPGFGITDALRDARALSRAILEGGDQALERYWRQRDVEAFELYCFAQDHGDLGYNNPLTRVIVQKAANDPNIARRLLGVFERTTSPYAAFTTGQVVRWTLGALLRGNLGVLRPFFKAGKRGMQVQRGLERRRALLTPALPAPASHVKQAA